MRPDLVECKKEAAVLAFGEVGLYEAERSVRNEIAVSA